MNVLMFKAGGGSQKFSWICRVGGREEVRGRTGREREEETAHLERAPLAINPDGWARRAVVVVRAVRSARALQTTPASFVGEAAFFAGRTVHRACGGERIGWTRGTFVLCSVGGERLAFPHRTRGAVDSTRVASIAAGARRALGAAGEDVGDSVERAILARGAARRRGEAAERAERARCENCSLRFAATSRGARCADIVDVAVVSCTRRKEEGRRG